MEKIVGRDRRPAPLRGEVARARAQSKVRAAVGSRWEANSERVSRLYNRVEECYTHRGELFLKVGGPPLSSFRRGCVTSPEEVAEHMKSDFLVALTQLAAERNLPREIVLSAIEAALMSAYRKDGIAEGQNISVKFDPGTGDMTVDVLKSVVDEVTDPQTEILLDDARKIKRDVEIGENLTTETIPHVAGRIAAQTAKQVVMQRLREAERELVYAEFSDKEGEVFTVNVQRMEPRQIIVDLGRAEAVLPASEQVPFERYRPGQKMKVLLKEVQRSTKGPELLVSRADKALLKRLFEMEVPEIYNGAVEIVMIAREPGARSKVAVRARQDGVDPVGSWRRAKGSSHPEYRQRAAGRKDRCSRMEQRHG